MTSGLYGKLHWSIYANDVRHQRLQILGWFFVADIIIGGFYCRLLAIVSDSGNPGFALLDRLHIHLCCCCCIFLRDTADLCSTPSDPHWTVIGSAALVQMRRPAVRYTSLTAFR